MANQPNSAQLEGTPTVPSSNMWVRVVVWECGEGQTDRHTDGRDQYKLHLALATPHAKCDDT